MQERFQNVNIKIYVDKTRVEKAIAQQRLRGFNFFKIDALKHGTFRMYFALDTWNTNGSVSINWMEE